jgi:hypothetical protein
MNALVLLAAAMLPAQNPLDDAVAAARRAIAKNMTQLGAVLAERRQLNLRIPEKAAGWESDMKRLEIVTQQMVCLSKEQQQLVKIESVAKLVRQVVTGKGEPGTK